MNLIHYFNGKKGTGILSTADKKGHVNSAIYARPHFLSQKEPHKLAFIMRDRLSHKFLESNPYAFYTFIEEGEGYKGKRLALKKIGEETSREKITSVRRRDIPDKCREGEEVEKLFLTHFEVKDTRPLVGTDKK